jgi:hypothetical protein
MRLQTCRRHPNAGPFLATCSGCTQELYDIEQANRARAAAPTALAIIGSAGAEILDATWVRGALVVVSHQPDAYFPYCVDSFRLPTPDETDPDQVDPRALDEWVLVYQYGDHSADAVPGMAADATAYLRELFPLKPLAA